MPRLFTMAALSLLSMRCCLSVQAKVLWHAPGPITVHNNGDGTNLLTPSLRHDDSSRDTLYFKFEVDPLSDVGTEEYFAAFQLFEGNEPRLAVGNSLKAWAYSAFNTEDTGENNKVAGDMDLRSSQPESFGKGDVLRYELPRRGIRCMILFKVQFVPDGADLVTAWMNPNLTKGATEENQPENLTTKFKANGSFDQLRLRHGGAGDGWIFRNLAIATSFNDFIVPRFWQQWWFLLLIGMAGLAAVGTTVRLIEKKKFQLQLQHAEQERALERERARIAQDLHDELGSLLTRITLLGGLLHTEMDNPKQVEIHAGKIAQAANQTVRALEEIVWAVRPGSDTLQSLVDYLVHFAGELFEGNVIRCRLDLPRDLPTRTLHPDVRHNIFLIVKEALTNVLKHSGGTVVHLQIQTDDGQLKIVIADDGHGFDPGETKTDREHNGLNNMHRRADSVSGQLQVVSTHGAGTQVTLLVDFTD